MLSRRSITTTVLCAMLLIPGGLAAQSIEISLPGIDVPTISVDISGVPDAADISAGVDAAVQYNESDFDFVSRAAEEAARGISEALVTTAGGIVEELDKIEDLSANEAGALVTTVVGILRGMGEAIESVMDELASIVVLCTSGDSCVPPDPPPPLPEP